MSSFISFYPLKMFRLLALVFIYLSFLFFFSLSDLNRSPILLVFMFLLTPFWAFWQFRAAIQLQFDFHRAIYNLGTVLVCFSIDLMLHYVQLLDLCTKCANLKFIVLTVWVSRGQYEVWPTNKWKRDFSYSVVQSICHLCCSCSCFEAQLLSIIHLHISLVFSVLFLI
jgi:uncharacterized membrane protein